MRVIEKSPVAFEGAAVDEQKLLPNIAIERWAYCQKAAVGIFKGEGGDYSEGCDL